MDDDEAYRRRFESVMRDVDDDGRDGADADSVVATSVSEPSTYTARMLDVLGSDGEDEDVQGYAIEPDLPNEGAGVPEKNRAAPPLQEQQDEYVDDEVAKVNGHVDGDFSMATEDASSVSSLSLKPLRPWQFPAPRRLRMLREDEGNSSIESTTPQLVSPSMHSSDEGSRAPIALLPYGEPLPDTPILDGSTSKAHGDNENREPASRSFLRISRLCVLSDKEGSPTVMAIASGIVAVGTAQGKVALFDRSRGWTGAISVAAGVSALAISSDKTFLAIGTTDGHIYLYDMAKLHMPSRHVKPVSYQAVAAGRSEGHLQNSRILHIAFVGTRHTAVVSADDHGLSFYHSLGRILGVSSNDTLRILGRYPDAFEAENPRKSTILAMATLPLGPQQHQSDGHNFVALLTPSKLVLVGLKPAARTWYRRLSPIRADSEEPISGCVAWLPCSLTTPSSATTSSGLVLPALAFSFGRFLYLARLHTQGQEVVVREWKSWCHDEPIEALQWLSHESIVLYSQRSLRLYDVRRGCCTEGQPFSYPIARRWAPERIAGREALAALEGSFKTHKGQLFVLTTNELLVGSLVGWADRLLAHVSQGDSLGAIELATELLRNPNAGGSRIGLPESFDQQKPVIASRLLELMRASTAYAFSEERMKDDMAHYSQGVDRTPLFEGLAHVCAEACLALDDSSFLFDELYDAFSDAGIESIFADQMEDFIVQGQIRMLPIPVVQRLVSFRKRQERYDLAERIIRNVDPSCLDLDQSTSLCLEHHLYDALIYIYTNALHDFVGPVVEFLPLVRRQESEAYRVFSYLSIVLIGRAYPDQAALQEDEARTARATLYSFIFSGRCVMWPQGPGGQLVLTLDKEFDEPTYPYLRLLLDFDAEAFLDAIDVAFEDAWLDEEDSWSRQKIISILFDLETSHEVRIFVAIFIARNAPKYPQFVHLPTLQVDELISALSSASPEDDDTKADRQFAVECLLSAYRPAQTSKLLSLFESAGFVEILRRVYRSEGKWDKLAEMMVSQPNDLTFDDLDDVLRRSKKNARVESIVLQALPTLVDMDAERCAALVQRRLGKSLNEAIHVLDRSPHRQLAFLTIFMSTPAARKFGLAIRSQYIALLCSMQPQQVVKCLDTHDRDFFDLNHVIEVTRDEDVLDGLLWAQDRSRHTAQGFDEMSSALSERALILRSKSDDADVTQTEEKAVAREQIQNLTDMAVRICTERADEALWVDLLQMLIRLTHDVHADANAMHFSRGLLQDSLSAFVSSTSAEDVSFSALFRRLAPEKDSTYAEVRDLADAMMGAYKVRQELLGITNRLFGRDVFAAMQRLTRQRRRGWRPGSSNVQCPGCGRMCIGEGRQGDSNTTGIQDAPHATVDTLGGIAATSPFLRRKNSAALDVAAQVPLPRSPSFLEPGVSPRPDKGKGVLRGLESPRQANASSTELAGHGSRSYDSWSAAPGSNQREGEGEDYFDDGNIKSAHRSDPTETFLATPAFDAEQMSMSFSFDAFMFNGYTANGIAPNHKDGDDPDLLDDVVVCFNGEVWHRHCAPPSLLHRHAEITAS